MKSHSRNAVACTRISNGVNNWVKENKIPGVDIEAVFFDPVPGVLPGLVGEITGLKESKKNKTADVIELKESTLVYSLHTEYKIGFAPQEVIGAKRLILSRKLHEVGYTVGVRLQIQEDPQIVDPQIYKGFSLNSLEPGTYISAGKVRGEEPEIIKKVLYFDDVDNLLEKYSKKKNQKDRRKIIKKVAESRLPKRRDL